MLLQSNKVIKLSQYYSSRTNQINYGLIIFLTSLRVLTSRTLECPIDFDCNAYIAMVNHWGYNAELSGHHAMRVLPSILVWGLTYLGASIVLGFHILSGATYVLFGCLLYYFFSSQKHLKPILCLSLSLLALAPHEAMRIPLQLVYQSCDMLVYPLSLLLVMFSLQKRIFPVFALCIISIFVRQNLFILGVSSLLYCFKDRISYQRVLALAMVIGLYSASQIYYQATGTFIDVLTPPEHYFTLKHFIWIVLDSNIYELFVPILPFLIIYFKPLAKLSWQYWHVTLYICITMGQPFLAYHLTGNNFARLALQGFWLLCLAIALVWRKDWQYKYIMVVMLVYSAAVYFTWGIKQRIWMLMAFIISLLVLNILFQTKFKAVKAS